MADFKLAYKKTMGVEKGYANDPDDSGGETWAGISRKNWPSWPGWQIIDSFKNKPGFEVNLQASTALENQVKSFFKQNFWDKMRLDEFNNQAIAEEMYDTGVNMSDTIAARFLQEALNATNRNQKEYADIDVDGVIGRGTVATVNQHPKPAQVLKLLNCQQGVRYMEICKSRPSQEKFMNSWLSRVTI